MEKRLLNLTELACEVGCSVQTINSYYRFKKENPESDIAMALPDFTRCGTRNTRYWKAEDVEAIKAFRESIPQGCKGIMGSVTQRYVKRNNTPKNTRKPVEKDTASLSGYGLYIGKVEAILRTNHVEEFAIEEVTEILRSELEWRTPYRAV